jgi:hypothetical protein
VLGQRGVAPRGAPARAAHRHEDGSALWGASAAGAKPAEQWTEVRADARGQRAGVARGSQAASAGKGPERRPQGRVGAASDGAWAARLVQAEAGAQRSGPRPERTVQGAGRFSAETSGGGASGTRSGHGRYGGGSGELGPGACGRRGARRAGSAGMRAQEHAGAGGKHWCEVCGKRLVAGGADRCAERARQ